MSADAEEAAPAAEGAEKCEKSYQELIANVNPIAQPLASKKLSKKLYKCVKKGKKKQQLCVCLHVHEAISCLNLQISKCPRVFVLFICTLQTHHIKNLNHLILLINSATFSLIFSV